MPLVLRLAIPLHRLIPAVEIACRGLLPALLATQRPVPWGCGGVDRPGRVQTFGGVSGSSRAI
jgi:hypothetical protein